MITCCCQDSPKKYTVQTDILLDCFAVSYLVSDVSNDYNAFVFSDPEDDRTTILQLVAVYQYLRRDNPETFILNFYKPFKPTKLTVTSLRIHWTLSALVVV
jgi:hypothetical protein